jgi:transglutaminase-like putative cysteine protease
MKLHIQYSANFVYAKSASLSPHTVRLFPRRDKFLSVSATKFSTAPEADIQYRSDLFDNLTAVCFFPKLLADLPFQLDLDLELEEKNPFHFLLASHALEAPFKYTGEEARVLHPYLKHHADSSAFPEESFGGNERLPTVQALAHITAWIHENIAYERREEGDPYSPEDTLRLESGSCRDMAVLQVAILHARGFAARLVSGFLWEDESVAPSERRAENALHAWVECYVPGAGWIALDPTNGVFADHHRIPTAVGIFPADIAPIAGHYYGKEIIESQLEATLKIQPVP